MLLSFQRRLLLSSVGDWRWVNAHLGRQTAGLVEYLSSTAKNSDDVGGVFGNPEQAPSRSLGATATTLTDAQRQHLRNLGYQGSMSLTPAAAQYIAARLRGPSELQQAVLAVLEQCLGLTTPAAPAAASSSPSSSPSALPRPQAWPPLSYSQAAAIIRQMVTHLQEEGAALGRPSPQQLSFLTSVAQLPGISSEAVGAATRRLLAEATDPSVAFDLSPTKTTVQQSSRQQRIPAQTMQPRLAIVPATIPVSSSSSTSATTSPPTPNWTCSPDLSHAPSATHITPTHVDNAPQSTSAKPAWSWGSSNTSASTITPTKFSVNTPGKSALPTPTAPIASTHAHVVSKPDITPSAVSNRQSTTALTSTTSSSPWIKTSPHVAPTPNSAQIKSSYPKPSTPVVAPPNNSTTSTTLTTAQPSSNPRTSATPPPPSRIVPPTPEEWRDLSRKAATSTTSDVNKPIAPIPTSAPTLPTSPSPSLPSTNLAKTTPWVSGSTLPTATSTLAPVTSIKYTSPPPTNDASPPISSPTVLPKQPSWKIPNDQSLTIKPSVQQPTITTPPPGTTSSSALPSAAPPSVLLASPSSPQSPWQPQTSTARFSSWVWAMPSKKYHSAPPFPHTLQQTCLPHIAHSPSLGRACSTLFRGSFLSSSFLGPLSLASYNVSCSINTSANTATATNRGPTQTQLALLQTLGYKGQTPTTEKTAKQTIYSYLKLVAPATRCKSAPNPTDSQRELLLSSGYKGPMPATKKEAITLIGQLLPSPVQLKCLDDLGHVGTAPATRAEADSLIKQLNADKSNRPSSGQLAVLNTKLDYKGPDPSSRGEADSLIKQLNAEKLLHPTSSQLQQLQSSGYKGPMPETKNEAVKLIGQLRASPEQLKYLDDLGHSGTAPANRAEAAELIAKLRGNIPPTAAQFQLLQLSGYKGPMPETKNEAVMLIDKLPASIEQLKYLDDLGHSGTAPANRAEAAELIAKLKDNV